MSTTDPDGFDLVSLLRENADLRIQLADTTAEADYLRTQLEKLLTGQKTHAPKGQQ